MIKSYQVRKKPLLLKISFPFLSPFPFFMSRNSPDLFPRCSFAKMDAQLRQSELKTLELLTPHLRLKKKNHLHQFSVVFSLSWIEASFSFQKDILLEKYCCRATLKHAGILPTAHSLFLKTE
ncbi:hypothetical protein CEXT_97681 [Caerostris extrusa]|uniref:Uncharacterized protein n=1 Tax=Caerostris extrusa TaxID=172846 RepID=A0AAV4XV49_CAEEX|nr:hypothetical protein CEXT_97681 [Caerostris extrusa]